MSRRDIVVRPARPEDAPQLIDWATRMAEQSLLDPEVFEYPSTTILAAHNDKLLAFLPFHAVVALESLALNPEADGIEIAMALRKLIEFTAGLGRVAGLREMYFVCADEKVNKMAEMAGFERLDAPLYRYKLER